MEKSMLEDFKLMYRILSMLEKSMDYEEFDKRLLDADTLRTNENRRAFVLKQLVREGYIEGITVIECDQTNVPTVKIGRRPCITIAGMQFLEENSMMKKVKELITGVIEIAK